MHNMGTSGAESEDTTKPPQKQKTYKNKTNPNERIEELEARNKALESSLTTAEEEKYNIQRNIEIKDNIIKDMGADIIKKNDKINALENKLQQTTHKLTETTKQLDRARDNKNKKDILILADSNRTKTIAHIEKKRPQWRIDAPERIFTTNHLIKYVEDNPIPKHITTLIMMGTNDIRVNNTKEAITNIQKLQKHTTNNTIISTIPPMNIDSGNEDTNEEIIEGRIQLNKEITKTYPTTVKTTSLNKSMRTNPHEILRDDGFHLNDKGVEQLAEEWIRTIEEPHTTNTNTQTTETMTINKDIAAHIIGKDGRNLKTMKEKHQITITTANDNHNNLTITITGNKDHTKEAIQDIKRTIETQHDNIQALEEKQQKYANKICRDYKQTGRCNWGTKCWFAHKSQDDDNDHTEKRRERSQQREPGQDKRRREQSREGRWATERRERESRERRRSPDKRTYNRDRTTTPDRNKSRYTRTQTPDREQRTHRSKTRNQGRDHRRSPSWHH